MHITLSDLDLDHLYIVHPGENSFALTENISAITLPGVLKLLQ